MKLEGNDNYGKPKQEYADKLEKMSAYANNNPRSDFHWHVNACYDECNRRNKPEIYKKAYDYNLKSVS